MGNFLPQFLQMIVISMMKPFAESFAKQFFELMSKKGKEKPALTSGKRTKSGKSK